MRRLWLSPRSSTALEENLTYHRVRVHKIGFTMLLVEFLVLMRFLSSCAAQLAGTLFRTKRYHQQPTQPRLVYSALVGRKCGRIPRTQPAFEDTGSQGQDPQIYILASTDYSCASRYIEKISRCIDYVCALTRQECLLYACCDW